MEKLRNVIICVVVFGLFAAIAVRVGVAHADCVNAGGTWHIKLVRCEHPRAPGR